MGDTIERRRKLILVADDDEDILSLISLCLEGADHEVLTARDGEEALELAQGRHPDLALLDVRMPNLNGYDVLRRIRNNGTQGMPVILVSAFATEDAIIQGREAGADDYITKPFSPNELLRRIEALARLPLGHVERDWLAPA